MSEHRSGPVVFDLLLYLCVCMLQVHDCAPMCVVCAGQRTIWWRQLYLYHMIPEMKSVLRLGNKHHWAFLLTQNSILNVHKRVATLWFFVSFFYRHLVNEISYSLWNLFYFERGHLDLVYCRQVVILRFFEMTTTNCPLTSAHMLFTVTPHTNKYM